MAEIVKLPSAATSYLTVSNAGGFFYVVLVTPFPGKALKTRILGFNDHATAIEAGKATAIKMQRPFKEGRH
jgi:hypothetical protein